MSETTQPEYQHLPIMDPGDLVPSRVDLERQRVEEFMGVVPNLTPAVLDVEVDILSNDPRADAINRYYYQTDTNEMQPTLRLVPEYASLPSGPMSFTPYKSQGGKSSRHGVIFGDLEFDEEAKIPLAVKPFQVVEHRNEAEALCLDDYFGNAAAHRMSLGGLEPVGIITDANGHFYSLTRLEKSLDTFDNLDWTDFYADYDNNPGMQNLWLQAAQKIAVVHSMGDSYHGDLYLRNIATNPEGQVFPIDWEYSHFSVRAVHDLEARFGHRWRDLDQLVTSMALPTTLPPMAAGAGMFMKTSEDWWSAFNKVFFDEYKEWRIHLASQGSHHMKQLGETQEELEQLELSLKAKLSDLQEKYAVVGVEPVTA